uniref:Protein kinase domain-containing protein n=1 Tax=Rhabditophanes sp. KR3021 TaxID=114890 RepID=A0AC35UDZ3_9BILA
MPDNDETALLTHSYQIVDIIEKGPLSSIYRVIQRSTGKAFTVKTISIGRLKNSIGYKIEDIDKEIEICSKLHNPYLIQLQNVIKGENSVHMIFEHLDGSDICFEIVKRASSGFVYSEAVASHYIKQLLEGLCYMHTLAIIHRDVRPHNILLAGRDNNAPLKVRGFTSAFRLLNKDSFCDQGKVGIPQFMAPEMVLGSPYNTASDIWSAGVVCYLLLSGKLPFNGPTEYIYESIKKGVINLEGSHWDVIQEPAKDLLIKMLNPKFEERISAADCLKHRWISDKSVPQRKHLNEAVDNIRNYNLRRKMKSRIISVVNHPAWENLDNKNISSQQSSTVLNNILAGGDVCDAEPISRISTNMPLIGKDHLNKISNPVTVVEKVTSSIMSFY